VYPFSPLSIRENFKSSFPIGDFFFFFVSKGKKFGAKVLDEIPETILQKWC